MAITKEQMQKAAEKLGSEFLKGAFSGRQPYQSLGLTQEEYMAYLALPDSDPIKMSMLGHILPEGKDGDRKEEKDKNRYAYQQMLLRDQLRDQERQLDEHLRELSIIAQALRDQIAASKKIIDDNNEWIREMIDRHKGAAPAIAYFDKEKHLERDENGEIKNKHARQLLEDYIERQRKEGKIVARPENDALAIRYIKDQMSWEANVHARDLRTKNEQEGDGIVRKEKALTVVDGLVKKLETIKSTHPNDPERRSQEYQKLLDEIEDPETIAEIRDGFSGDEAFDIALRKEKDQQRQQQQENSQINEFASEGTSVLAKLSIGFKKAVDATAHPEAQVSASQAHEQPKAAPPANGP